MPISYTTLLVQTGRLHTWPIHTHTQKVRELGSRTAYNKLVIVPIDSHFIFITYGYRCGSVVWFEPQQAQVTFICFQASELLWAHTAPYCRELGSVVSGNRKPGSESDQYRDFPYSYLMDLVGLNRPAPF